MRLCTIPQPRALVAATLVGSLCSFAALPCAADPLTDYIIHQQIYDTFPRNLMLQQQRLNAAKLQQLRQNAAQDAAVSKQLALDNVRAEKFGRQRIAAGRASTSFVRGPHLAPAEWASADADPAARQKDANEYARALQTFETIAAQHQVKINDSAQTFGLAFALAYIVYSGGRAVNGVQINDFVQQERDFLLHDPAFQGKADPRRQLEVEQVAITAVLAVSRFAEANRLDDAARRDDALKNATTVLEHLWTRPLSALELTSAGFRDRGQRVVREGKATTRVALSPTPITTDPTELEYWDKFVTFAKARGIAVDDLAQVHALAISINYELYTGRALTAAQFAGTTRAMSHDILSDAGFQGATDREKQQLIEKLAIDAVSTAVTFRESSKTLDDIARTRQSAKKNLDEIFAPQRVFDNYVLGPNGFQLKSGAQR